MTDPDPYAPPSSPEEVPATPSPNRDTLLRRVGALSMGYVVVRALWLNWGPDPAVPMPVWSVVGGVAIMCLWIYGFLCGGRKFHLWIAHYMALTMAVQAYFTNRAIAHPELIPAELLSDRPWLELALGCVPLAVAMVCATALYVRARRAGRGDEKGAGVEPRKNANGREI